MSYFSKFQQNIVVSLGNSWSTNIGAGATYTGTIDTSINVAGIQVAFFCNQNCLIYVDQSIDTTPTGPHWDISDEYQYYANESFGITIQAISTYFRVRVVNQNALVGTTGFRLQTILCPIVEVVPRSLNDDGNFKVSIYGFEDEYGFEVENTPMGEMRTVIPTRLVGAAFEGTVVDTNFWIIGTAVGTASVIQANAQCVLATTPSGSTINGAIAFWSTRRARYVSASGMNYRSIIQLSAGVTYNKRRFGIAWGTTMPTITDGAYFELDGSTFSIVTRRAGLESRISSGAFNGTLGLTYDPGITVHTYEIYWTNSSVWFVLNDQVLHKVSATSATWAATMSPYIYMDNVNSNSINSNNLLTCRVASIRRLGQLSSQSTHKYQAGTTAGVICKYGPGNLNRIIISSMTTSGAVITLRDGTDASGSIIHQFTTTMGNQNANGPFSIDMGGLPFFNGLFLVIATQNANVTVIYE